MISINLVIDYLVKLPILFFVMQKQSLLAVSLFCLFFLSSCKAPNPETQDLSFSNGSSQQESQQSDTGQIAGSQTQKSQNYQLETPTQEGTPMKQLSDFEPIEGSVVTLTTTKGDITFDLFRDKAPLTTLNFLTLAKSGFYDNIIFHRIIPDFMAQVGDPKTKEAGMEAAWGTGGPGYAIADEFDPSLTHDSEGVVSMANSGPNTGGSQFFITYEATTWLDGKHAVFGKVTSGMDVLRQLEVGDKILSVTIK